MSDIEEESSSDSSATNVDCEGNDSDESEVISGLVRPYENEPLADSDDDEEK